MEEDKCVPSSKILSRTTGWISGLLRRSWGRKERGKVQGISWREETGQQGCRCGVIFPGGGGGAEAKEAEERFVLAGLWATAGELGAGAWGRRWGVWAWPSHRSTLASCGRMPSWAEPALARKARLARSLC